VRAYAQHSKRAFLIWGKTSQTNNQPKQSSEFNIYVAIIKRHGNFPREQHFQETMEKGHFPHSITEMPKAGRCFWFDICLMAGKI
jgi:hypothetical protein